MKNRLTLYIAFLLVATYVINSCTSKTEKKVPLEVKKEVSYPREIKKRLKNFVLLEQDFVLDTLFMQDSIKNHLKYKLSINEVKFLSSKLKDDDVTEPNSYYLNDYIKIERAKKTGKYAAFVERLDIGMMKDASCYALGRVEFGDSLAVLIWKIDFSSYEACPFYSGTHFLATLISNGELIECMQIACSESAGDAPMSSETVQEAKFSKKGRLNYRYESSVYEDENQIEHAEDKFVFDLKSKGFIKR
ncbi:MAG: hypothetical protein V4622_03505 [Bacteroidota bacterium]